MPTCDILLATYNGGKYLSALLDSLLNQDHIDFRLVVRDDGSTDETCSILREYEPKFSGRMHQIETGAPSGSAKANFSILMEHSTSEYILFADQDDVWFEDKVRKTLQLLIFTEKSHPPETPVYVFTDVVPVDSSLCPVSNSYWHYKKINPHIATKLSQLIVCPPMLGCASGINRSLLHLSTPVDERATGHDWWCLLLAASVGVVAYSNERTMLYRLHGGNSSMQKRVSLIDYVGTKGKFAKVRRGMHLRNAQIQAVLERSFSVIEPPKKETIERFIGIQLMGKIAKTYSTIRWNYLYPDFARNIAMIVAS